MISVGLPHLIHSVEWTFLVTVFPPEIKWNIQWFSAAPWLDVAIVGFPSNEKKFPSVSDGEAHLGRWCDFKGFYGEEPSYLFPHHSTINNVFLMLSWCPCWSLWKSLAVRNLLGQWERTDEEGVPWWFAAKIDKTKGDHRLTQLVPDTTISAAMNKC